MLEILHTPCETRQLATPAPIAAAARAFAACRPLATLAATHLSRTETPAAASLHLCAQAREIVGGGGGGGGHSYLEQKGICHGTPRLGCWVIPWGKEKEGRSEQHLKSHRDPTRSAHTCSALGDGSAFGLQMGCGSQGGLVEGSHMRCASKTVFGPPNSPLQRTTGHPRTRQRKGGRGTLRTTAKTEPAEVRPHVKCLDLERVRLRVLRQKPGADRRVELATPHVQVKPALGPCDRHEGAQEPDAVPAFPDLRRVKNAFPPSDLHRGPGFVDQLFDGQAMARQIVAEEAAGGAGL